MTRFHLHLQATYDEVRRALDWLDDRLAPSPMAGRRDDIGIAVAEALTNICRHGYADRGSGAIEVRLTLREAACSVSLTDHGIEPTRNLLQQAIQSGDEPAESGMGIPLIIALCDAVRFGRRGNRNTLILGFNARTPRTLPDLPA